MPDNFQRDCLIVDLHKKGRSVRDISTELNVHRSSVQRTVTRFKTTGATKASKGGGRPKKCSPTKERAMFREARTSTDVNASVTQKSHPDISLSTIQRTLRARGLGWHPKAKKPRLTELQRLRRQTWARRWKGTDWTTVVWTDEKRFPLKGDSGPTHCWRMARERYSPKFLQGKTKFKGGSLMVWGSMTAAGVVELVRCTNTMNATEYIKVLEELVKKCPKLASRDTTKPTLMHDGAACHTAHVTEAWLKTKNVQVLPWVANSPDLNPIETLWAILARKLRGQLFPNEDAVWVAVKAAWDAITPAECGRLVASMERRMKAVRKARGHPTKY